MVSEVMSKFSSTLGLGKEWLFGNELFPTYEAIKVTTRLVF